MKVKDTFEKKVMEYINDFGNICVHKAMEITKTGMGTASKLLSDMEKKGLLIQLFDKENCELGGRKHTIYVKRNKNPKQIEPTNEITLITSKNTIVKATIDRKTAEKILKMIL